MLVDFSSFQRESGRYEEAIRLGQRAVDLDPYNSQLHSLLGSNHRMARNYDDAIREFQIALELNPANPNAIVNVAMAEASRGNSAEALQALEVVEQFGGVAANRLGQMAMAYSLAGRPEEVARLVDEFGDSSDESFLSDAHWAMIHLALGGYEQALERLERLLNEETPGGFNAIRIPLIEIKANSWSDPVLDEDQRFVEIRDRIFAL